MREGWREVTLEEVVELNPEQAEPEERTGSLLYIDLAGVSAGTGIDKESVRALHWDDAPSRARRKTQAGDVLVSTVRPYLRGFGQVDDALADSIASTGFCVVRAIPELIDAGFVWALVRSDRFVAYLTDRQTGSNYPAVRPDDIGSFPVHLPPFAEQRRIADLMGAVDSVIERGRARLNAARHLARTLRNEGIVGIAARVKLADAVEVTMGRQRSPRHQSGAHMVPYLRAANVKDGQLELGDVLSMNFDPEEQEKFGLRNGDTLITEGCGSLAQIGAAAQWCGEIDGVVCFQNTLLRLRAKAGITVPGFVHHWARWAFETGAFATVASGTNIFHVGAKRAEVMPFPSIPVDEQEQIAARLDSVEDSVVAAQRELAALDALRRGILATLLAGEHEIPESYDRFLEPVEAGEERPVALAA